MSTLTALRGYARALRAWAQNNITEYEAGTDWVTDEGKRLEGEYEAAYAGTPRWLARLVDWHVLRQLDYLHRTRQPRARKLARAEVAWWASWLAVTVVIAAGAYFIAGAVTRPGPAVPVPAPSVFTPSPAPAPAAPAPSTGCAS